jgi:transposase
MNSCASVHSHFTPTYLSWLNQVELWFAKIQRDVIDRGVFTSVADLSRKIRKYIQAYRQVSQTFPLDLHRSQAPHQGF